MTRPYRLGGPTRIERIAGLLHVTTHLRCAELAAILQTSRSNVAHTLTTMRALKLAEPLEGAKGWRLTATGRAWVEAPTPLGDGRQEMPAHQKPRYVPPPKTAVTLPVKDGWFVPAPTKLQLMGRR